MSAEEFWKDDPQLFVSYRTSFINKKKRELEEWDFKCWLQGLYIHDGNGKVISSLKQFLANMFSKKKDTTKIPEYPDRPYFEKKNNIDKQEKQKDINYQNYQNSLYYFGTLKDRYLKKMEKGE